MLLEGAFFPRALVLPQYLHKFITNNINIEVPFSDSNQPFLQHVPQSSYLIIYIHLFRQNSSDVPSKQKIQSMNRVSGWS